MKKNALHESSKRVKGPSTGRVSGEEPMDPPRVIVKFVDSVELPYEDGAEVYVSKRGVGPWDDIARGAQGISLRRLFTSLRVDQIRALIDRATFLDPSYDAPNLLAYFVVDCPPKVDPHELAEKFKRWPTVQTAYVDGRAGNAGLDPPPDTNPDFSSQGYLQPAPAGIGATYTWSNYAAGFGAGAGIHVIDVEQGWTLDHEDLRDQNPKLLYGTILDSGRAHGTAVLGVIGAVDNSLGGVGIAPKLAGLDAVSYIHMVYSETAPFFRPAQNIPDAITVAAHNLSPGDVLVIAQEYDYLSPGFPPVDYPHSPVEAVYAIFQAIQVATKSGIVVVEAAGNGTSDLDSTLPFLNQRDSGAIIVGAANPTSTPQYLIGKTTNYGSKVNCFAWGHGIFTCTSDPTGAKSLYTDNFGGTSGATAIVAGAAVVAQGIAQATLGYRLSPQTIRLLFSSPDLGTKSANWPNDKIGVMPDLEKISNFMKMFPVAPMAPGPGPFFLWPKWHPGPSPFTRRLDYWNR